MNKKQKPYGPPKNQLDRIYKRDKGICWLCLSPVPFHQATKDHYIPISRKDEFGMAWDEIHRDQNIRLAHARCNNKRGNQLESEMWDSIDWHAHPASGRRSEQSYANRPKRLRKWGKK